MARPISTMTRLMGLEGVRPLMLACGLLAALAGAATLAQWALVARIVDGLAFRRVTPAALSAEFLLLGAAWLARSALGGVREALAGKAAARMGARVREQLFGQLLTLGPAFAAAEQGGELAETVMAGADKLGAFVGRFVPGAVFAAVVPPLLALAVLVLDPLSGLILLLTGPLVVLFLWLVGGLARDAADRQWAALGRLGANFADTLRVLSTLVVFGEARARFAWLSAVEGEYRRATLSVLRAAFLSGFVLEFGATLCTALVAVTVGVRLFEGRVEFFTALLALLLTPEFFAPLRALGGDHHAAMEARAAGERLFELLDAPSPAQGRLPVLPGVPSLSLRRVTLRCEDRLALRDVSIDLPAGSRTALIGESGAGKTSVARLLLGFASPTEGEVRVNGVSLSDLDPEAWRARVAYVPERPYLFPGSVLDNLRLGREDAPPEEVEAAARAAGAHDFIARLPLGYATPVGEDGARLSGGERLRLALARAFLKKAPVLILDEPTSQLDAESEDVVRRALEKLGAGKTVLLITHRAALRADFGRVYELERGEVVAFEDADIPLGVS